MTDETIRAGLEKAPSLPDEEYINKFIRVENDIEMEFVRLHTPLYVRVNQDEGIDFGVDLNIHSLPQNAPPKALRLFYDRKLKELLVLYRYQWICVPVSNIAFMQAAPEIIRVVVPPPKPELVR